MKKSNPHAKGTDGFVYTARLPLSSATLNYLADLIRGYLTKIGSRWRALPAGKIAGIVLAVLRCDQRPGDLAGGNGVHRTTVTRWVREVSLAGVADSAAQELRSGLMAHPRTLPTRFGYDEAGSRLFEEIMRLPEYYLPEAETALFHRYGQEIIRHAGSTELVDLGAGNARKAALLLEALAHEQRLTAYTGVDVCAQPLREAARRIKQRWPDAEVTTVHSDFDHGLSWLRGRTEYRLLALLGSTYGNLSQVERRRFLDGVRRCCGPTDRLLLCIDQPQRLVGALHAAQRRQAETEPAAERHTTALVGDPLLERRVGGRVAAGPVSDDAAFHSLRVEFHGLGHTGQMECVVGDAGARLGTGATPEEGGLRFVVATSVHVEAHGEVEEVRHERVRRPVARQQLAAERALYVP
ncbi:L-histidine N(alpha)-methyltransferase [Streptomyces sp. cg2]|uniref:L-histidine N(alpha)-methyltransferase n=1 Tax=Streptomyces sp. cg2 TaxID=3238799 RepID=UPI0034E23D2F